MGSKMQIIKLGALIGACACMYGSCEMQKKEAGYAETTEMQLEQRITFLQEEINSEYKKLPLLRAEGGTYLAALKGTYDSLKPAYDRLEPAIKNVKAEMDKDVKYMTYLQYGAFGLFTLSFCVPRQRKEDEANKKP